MLQIRNGRDLLAGLLFLGFAAILAYNALQLPIGTARQMGPGYFPLALALLLAGFGTAILIRALRVAGTAPGRIDLRGAVLVILSIVAFGLAIRRFGFVPAVVLTVVLSSLGSREFRSLPALALTLFLAVFCWLVFIRGLGMPVALFGT